MFPDAKLSESSFYAQYTYTHASPQTHANPQLPMHAKAYTHIPHAQTDSYAHKNTHNSTHTNTLTNTKTCKHRHTNTHTYTQRQSNINIVHAWHAC